jgi:hypothetical protein
MAATMTVSRMKWVARFAGCAIAVSSVAGQAFAWQSGKSGGIRRLYVEPFTTRTGSEKLRDDLIAELHKLSSFSIVSSETAADAILSGGGEIWVKGYRSLNPRSGRLPSDGTPLYAGYLSVELKDPKGETLWSYLVTPGSEATDVSKDISRRIAKLVAGALEQEASPFLRHRRANQRHA